MHQACGVTEKLFPGFENWLPIHEIRTPSVSFIQSAESKGQVLRLLSVLQCLGLGREAGGITGLDCEYTER